MSQVLIRRHICEFFLKNKDHSSLFRSRLSSALSYSSSISFNLIDHKKFRSNRSFTSTNNYLIKRSTLNLSNSLFLINNGNNSIQSYYIRHHIKEFHSTSRLLDDKSNNNNDDNDGKNNTDNPNETTVPIAIPNMSALAPLAKVPDFLPKIPIVAISRNPLFPKFVKMIEVNSLYF
jgi:hypothetical protein